MGKKAAGKQQVTEFSMSIHMGICHGPVDAITGLFVGEKLAWEGEVTDEAGVYVNAPSLFGGPTDGGGVGGVMYYLPGGRDQVMPEALAQRLGLTSATCPAFRGVASVFFVGTDGAAPGSLDTSGGSPDPGVTDPGTGSGGYGTGGSSGGGGGGRNPTWHVNLD